MTDTGRTIPMLAESIATDLGEDWKAQAGDQPQDAYLVRKSNSACKIYVHPARSPQKKGKIEFSGVYPPGAREHGAKPVRHTCYAAPTRSSTALARQLTRYLLPKYEVDLAQVSEILADRAREQARAEVIARDIMTAFGLPWRGLDANASALARSVWTPIAFFWTHPETVIRKFRADPMPWGQVEFRFSVHANHAVKIAKFLAALPPVD
ncbi:conserved hypothetical protein [Frankia sp. AiPs1]|uniref:hypothetical protein n=1 Tax=Frankia sp. AiPa1 TaxID=573492 RepID=UPI00202B712D|nr:hypothetical protein [Frankia sp. AiPa1]MCL9758951.1 hypothetical protein [Frankia sp. AiPa1]